MNFMNYAPTRGRLLVTNLVTEDTVRGIVLLPKTLGTMTGLQVEVERVGQPYYDEDEDTYEEIPANEGDWLVLRDRWCRVPTEDPDLFVISIHDIAARFTQ